MDVPVSIVPFDLRIPNKKVWVRLDESMTIQQVWERIENL